MIEFLTLFLGLATGPHTVELAVSDPVAQVEVQLDGRPVATLDRPPWRCEVDFGAELHPHLLVAVGRDGAGKEIARTVQRINLPTPLADARIVLERGPDGAAVAARLTWQSVTSETPSRIAVTLDGQLLPVADPERIPLPPHDPRQLHFLQAELEFPEDIHALAALTFGGVYADQVATELTAVPVSLDGSAKLPSVAQLQGWFRADGRTLRVVATEEGAGHLVLVADLEAQDAVRDLFPRRGSVRYWYTLDRDHRTQLLCPDSRPVLRRGMRMDLFPQATFPAKEAGLLWLLGVQAATFVDARPERQQLTDAVAVAALGAAGSNRRRAVVLVLGRQPRDQSRLDPATVRAYLRDLHVPFEVWAFGDPPAEALAGWGEVRRITSPALMRKAVKDLKELLDAQRIIWVDGSPLPNHIELAPEARGIRLAR